LSSSAGISETCWFRANDLRSGITEQGRVAAAVSPGSWQFCIARYQRTFRRLASARTSAPSQLDIREEERCAIVHEHMDRHYREVLDQPIPMLGGKSPRAAVRTAGGRIEVAGWLKMMENRTAKAGDDDTAMAMYNFDWLWTGLGIDELRR
jgi:hypothetical protein